MIPNNIGFFLYTLSMRANDTFQEGRFNKPSALEEKSTENILNILKSSTIFASSFFRFFVFSGYGIALLLLVLISHFFRRGAFGNLGS
jgi:hypothetical protein